MNKAAALLLVGLTAGCQSASAPPPAVGALQPRPQQVQPAQAVLALPTLALPAPSPRQDFTSWLSDLQGEAQERGVSQETFARAFASVTLNEAVLKADRHQPEFTRPVWEYLDSAVSPRRIATGRLHLSTRRTLLDTVAHRYGVDPQYIVAIWGIESDFGANMGSYSVIEALTTLAYAGKRKETFREYLLQSLEILEKDNVAPAQMVGSWAGAMGQTQFMPTAFRQHAQDFDGDGRRDIWSSLPDIFASNAHYLAAAGWRLGEPWGHEVRLPAGFPYELAELDERRPVAEWRELGVQLVDARAAVPAGRPASLLLPAGYRGPAFLVYDNFRTILRYNNATSYALAVGYLADRIDGGRPIASVWPVTDKPLSRSESLELQELLASRGYDPGPADGMIGPKTRRAIRDFQRAVGQPADGYATVRLLTHLRDEHG